MKKDTVLSIEEELGYRATIAIEAGVSQTPHKEIETRISVRLSLGDGEREVTFNTERHNLENLYRSLNELLIEIPYPKQAPF